MKTRQIGQFLGFLLQSIALGLAVAFVLVYFKPEWLPTGSSSTGKSPSSFPGEPVSYRDAVSLTAPAVVNVYASKLRTRKPHPLFQDPLFRRFFGKTSPETQRENSLGSGVIINNQGYVLTNAHVIKAADEILLTLTDGRQTFAEVVGTDEETDLAVLKINLEKCRA